MKYFYGALIVIGLCGLFFLFYYLNKKTPKPEGCDVEIEDEKCINCQSPFCHLKKNKEKGEKV